MATNPKMPDFPNVPLRPTDDHAKVHVIRKSKSAWPILAIIAGAAILIAIIAVLPKAPRATRPPAASQAPQQPTPGQIQFSDVRIVPAPVGDALYLTAQVTNTGSTDITGAQVDARFLGKDGQALESTPGTLQSVSGGTSAEDLTQKPIKPNESREVRIYFEHSPKGWNHEVPSLTVTTVTGTPSS